MAKMNESGKWKKRWATGLSLSMAAVLSLGIFAACKTTDEEEEPEEEESAAMPADTQLLKNGNFEFYSEMTKDEDELRAILNTPTSWSFSSGSPSSDTKSGLVDLKYWDSITKSNREFTDINDAYTNWDEGSIYDKLNFFYKCDNPSNNSEYDPFEDAYDALAADSAEKTFFNEQTFSSVDFEDVQYLRDDLGASVALHGDTDSEKSDERGILMIHNRRTSDGAVGTAQSYSSSTTITLQAGTSAKISVWVKTAKLRHYYSDLKGENDTLDGLEVKANAGAYIGVTQTVGGTTLDQMQIKNINTEVTNKDGDDNGWEQYTVYVRGSTFATTTVKLVLGLGQGSSDDRYEAVNGYALFDDVECKIIKNDKYLADTDGFNYTCDINSKKNAKLFDATWLSSNLDYDRQFAIDLYAGAGDSDFAEYVIDPDKMSFGLTEEKTESIFNSNSYTSKDIDKSLDDNRTEDKLSDGDKNSIVGIRNADNLINSSNGYLRNIAKNDFKNFPFTQKDILLILSTNGAAYTAKSEEFPLAPESRILVSFFVKTSEVINGRTGASITLVDGANKTTISAFDSTTIATVDITNPNDEASNQKDIYDGWVQCFFFVSNDTEEPKTFSLEFSLGPTSIAGSDKYDYGQGYAAFANFETKVLTKTELSYASTGERAKKVTLTGSTEDTTVFDEASKVFDIEQGLANPQNFEGVLAGSKRLVAPTEGNTVPDNEVPEGLLTGLLNYKHAKNYGDIFKEFTKETGDDAWTDLFSDNVNKTALQPLVIMNPTENDLPSYGYFASNATISANSYQKISLRVKLSKGATATVYLTDVSEFGSYNHFLAPNAPKVTYWYDGDGNICKSDPTAKGYKASEGIVFELQTNGLYRKADDANDTTYYANLQNYKEKDGNLVTNGDAIAFYGNDGKFYAYRTENEDGTYSYSTEVKDLYENGGKEITRYDYTKTEFPESVIEVTNEDGSNSDWVTVTFYVHTGSEAKDYRLEIWAGDRKGENAIPAGGYVFFDRYTSSSISNYVTLLEETVDILKDQNDIEVKDNLPEKDKNGETLAYYYTFTYYDSVNYLRYDVNEDTEELGNPYASYDQSTHSEELIYLVFDDLSGNHTAPSKIRFLNYAASDVTVEADDLTEEEEEEEEDEENEISTGDILLIVSSALLGVVLIFVIVMLLVRHFTDKRRRSARATATVEDKRYKPSKKKEAVAEEEEENPFVKNRKAKEAAEKAKAEEAKPEEAPAETPEETPAEGPAEETAEPAPEEAPAEEPAETPAEESTEAPAEGPAESDNGSEE